MGRPDPLIVEITPLFVTELARALDGAEVVVCRIPDVDEEPEPVAVVVRSGREVARP